MRLICDLYLLFYDCLVCVLVYCGLYNSNLVSVVCLFADCVWMISWWVWLFWVLFDVGLLLFCLVNARFGLVLGCCWVRTWWLFSLCDMFVLFALCWQFAVACCCLDWFCFVMFDYCLCVLSCFVFICVCFNNVALIRLGVLLFIICCVLLGFLFIAALLIVFASVVVVFLWLLCLLLCVCVLVFVV